MIIIKSSCRNISISGLTSSKIDLYRFHQCCTLGLILDIDQLPMLTVIDFAFGRIAENIFLNRMYHLNNLNQQTLRIPACFIYYLKAGFITMQSKPQTHDKIIPEIADKFKSPYLLNLM